MSICSCPSRCEGQALSRCDVHGCQPQLDAWDADVLLCTLEGVDHDWRPEDRTPPGVEPGNPWYICSVCVWCHAARCGHLGDPDPCLLPRHHVEPHRYQSGATQAVGA